MWPASNEQGLIDTVIGFPGMTEMPAAGTSFFVAFLIFLAAMVALVSTLNAPPMVVWLARIAMFGVGTVFFARGLGGFFFAQLAWEPVEPFATYNRVFYSPLCLAIATGFFLLLIKPNKPNRSPVS